MPDLTVFETEYLPNMEQAKLVRYKDWERMNPGEAAKWVTYRDALLAGQDPEPPVLVSPFGKMLVAAGKMAGPEGSSPPPPSNLLLDEQFNVLDSNRWVHKFWWNGDTFGGSNPQNAEVIRAANCTIRNGQLVLTAKRETATSWQGEVLPYTSGWVFSGGINWNIAPVGFEFLYGKIEARMKVAKGNGMWSGLWSQGRLNGEYNDSHEFDVVEVIGREPRNLHMNYHMPLVNKHIGHTYTAPFDLGDDFHVYGFEWRPGFVAWYFDGVERFRYTGSDVANFPHYLMINLSVGKAGGWAGAPDASTVFPNEMLIDWVRVSP